ncbi:PREDICTED: U3 small nucleolar RNA-associated protein 14 homolog A [Dinoponera quadriceps]|uniref:U3 small nucleolar RNA-associated protein 14 homolog A n=1 Tax=Dinoponera quadriceps TaxID=609295 RepID=A0A6P3WZV7_DINQU|nr:PREDICTED: U3 small nucleolar RNA-associated protein 14 homolog A [Dinoponera quadriceps]
MNDLEDSDREVSKNHSKLIEAVEQLDKKQRVNKAERNEPTLEVSEYHLVKSGITNKDAVHVGDLLKSLKQKGFQSQISKKVRSVQKKSKHLSKPLPAPLAKKLGRQLHFDHVKKDLHKWDAVVARNRTATHLSFPLATFKKKGKNKPIPHFLDGLRLKSELQRKLEALEEEVESTVEKLAPEEKDEVKDKPELTLEEMKLKRHEAARLRAQQSYQEAKAHRERKIKSKKFHRIERKKKIKQQLKEFEELQKTNPEEALAKLQQLDRTRAEERMSLRHKSTGQWAKNKQIRARYDKETRQVLAEQLSIGRELTQKVRPADDSGEDDENDENEAPLVLLSSDKDNPWMNSVKKESEIDEFIKSYRKYHDKKKKKAEEEIVAEVEPKPAANKRKLDDKSEKQISDKPNKADDTITSVVTSTSQKTSESIQNKRVKKKMDSSCIVSSNETGSRKKKVKLFDKKTEAKTRNKCAVGATSTWHVEELQRNEETDFKAKKDTRQSKTSKKYEVNVDDMFDSVEENIKQKVDLKLQRIKKKLEEGNKVNRHEKEQDKGNKDYTPNLEFKNSKQKPELDVPLEETTSKENPQHDLTDLKAIMNSERETADKSNNYTAEIDPQKYLSIKPKHLKTQMPDLDVDGENILDNDELEEETHKIMSEAFADDDVVEEFRREKEEEIKNSQPQNIDLSLPGWGSWAGTNIKEGKGKRKNKRFITKFPKDTPRKDENKGDVIIFESENKKLKEHLISELPYPFTTVGDFEASMRAPLGRTFVPENAHRRLIQPSVVTKSGQVIEPMTEDMLVQKQPAVKRRIDKQKKNSMKNEKKKRE